MKLKNKILTEGAGVFYNGNVHWSMLEGGGHFCVKPGIFVSNRVFVCRTMHFALEPGFFVSNECYNTWYLYH